MILDRHEFFRALTTGLDTIGGNTSSNSDYRDVGVANEGNGRRKRYLNIKGLAALSGGTTPKVTITLVSDSDPGFATAKVTNWSSGSIDVPVNTPLKVLLPEDIKRYSRIEWAVTGSPTGGGTFRAFISQS